MGAGEENTAAPAQPAPEAAAPQQPQQTAAFAQAGMPGAAPGQPQPGAQGGWYGGGPGITRDSHRE
ncbi:hypothetical protein AB0G46_00005, partial [Streptomyces sp. NPDC020667]